jgi:hypothetical protein
MYEKCMLLDVLDITFILGDILEFKQGIFIIN